MRHPSQATLALHAGGDLAWFASWRTERHVSQCSQCREEIAAFEGLREALPGLVETPEIPWNRLAAEMKANIRLGLAAGECVRSSQIPLRESPLFTSGRAIVAFASIVVLVVTGVALEHPAPLVSRVGVELQATRDFIQVKDGEQALRLMNPQSVKPLNVMYSANAQGSMRARYVDPETGYVTINNVDAQ
jgi:hypothetical protein